MFIYRNGLPSYGINYFLLTFCSASFHVCLSIYLSEWSSVIWSPNQPFGQHFSSVVGKCPKTDSSFRILFVPKGKYLMFEQIIYLAQKSTRFTLFFCVELTFRTICFYFETIFNIVVTDSTSRVLSLTISAIPIRASSVLVDDSGPHFTANSFPTPSFPLTSEKFHFVSFRFVRVLFRPNPRPPTLNTANQNFFGFRFRNPIIRLLKPSQFQKSNPVLVQFLLTGIGTGGSNCQTGVTV